MDYEEMEAVLESFSERAGAIVRGTALPPPNIKKNKHGTFSPLMDGTNHNIMWQMSGQ